MLDGLSESPRAECAERGRDELLALLAHELRNPLAPVRTAVQILRMSPAGDSRPACELLPMMERQLAHVARVLEYILDVERQIELRDEPGDVALVRAGIEAIKQTNGIGRPAVGSPPRRAEAR